MDMRHVYDDVVLGGYDIVLDMLNVHYDVVLQGDDVVIDMDMSLRRFHTRQCRNRHFDRSTRCRNDIVSCPNDIVLDMCNVYNDVVWGKIDVVNDMRNVY